MLSTKGKTVGVYTKHVRYTCPHCGAHVCEAPKTSPSVKAGAIVGGVLGFMVGGPAGAVAGALGGAALSPDAQTCPTTGQKYKIEY